MKKKNNLKVLKFPNKLNEVEKKVEAILFSAAEPLNVEAIKDKIRTRTDLQKILNSLQQHYKDRGINLVCISNKWSFRTSAKLTHFMKLQTPTQKKLSKATIETLAIIVYHQPVTRSEIEEIRGVAFATGTLEILLKLNWVRPSGRKDVPGKPLLYITTDDFLSHFNLKKLTDLPNIEELQSAGLIDSSSVDSSIFGTGKFYQEQEVERKENIYSNIDDMLNHSLKPEDD
jgi:segregation and condensation protein B